MNRAASNVLVILLSVTVSGCAVSHALKESIPSSAPTGIRDERTERIGAVVKETMRREKIPGVSVAVIDRGELVWAQGFGWRDIEKRLPVDTETRFQAASISKPITALAVLVLNAAGSIDLDKEVNVLLKDWQLPSRHPNCPVTLRHLLTHQAGTVPAGFMGFSESGRVPTLVEVLNGNSWNIFSIRRPVRVVRRPGSGFRYSGGGYCVVQKALEDSQGESFPAIMSRNLLVPLMMTRSSFRQPPGEEEVQNSAHGYGWLNGILFPGRWRIYPEAAAAGLWTTPSDLARIIVAVQRAYTGDSTGTVSPEIAREFLKPQFQSWMGMGVFLGGGEGDRNFSHGGTNWGYVSRFGANVTNGRGWVIMSNGMDDDCFGPILEVIHEIFPWDTGASEVMDKEGIGGHNKPDAAKPAVTL